MDTTNPPEASLSSTKPYLVRALYEWILDNALTPHLLVDAQYPGTQVPADFVEDGQIVLNIAPTAVRNLVIGNDRIEFGARFGGVARELSVPCEAVLGIFSRENHQGMVFPQPEYPRQARGDVGTGPGSEPQARPADAADAGPGPRKRGTKAKGGPNLKVVK
ncbi:MAG: ClpXP protease specificity-enhancing factor [Bdellovibrio bacteriovorus]